MRRKKTIQEQKRVLKEYLLRNSVGRQIGVTVEQEDSFDMKSLELNKNRKSVGRASAYVRDGINIEEQDICDENLLTVFANIDPFIGLDLNEDGPELVDQDLPPSKFDNHQEQLSD